MPNSPQHLSASPVAAAEDELALQQSELIKALLVTVQTCPYGDTLDKIYSRLNVAQVQAIVTRSVETLIRRKVLYRYRLRGRYFLVAIDGTGVLTFPERHCPHCLTVTHTGSNAVSLAFRFACSWMGSSLAAPPSRSVKSTAGSTSSSCKKTTYPSFKSSLTPSSTPFLKTTSASDLQISTRLLKTSTG
jgi:hypothetical protein